MASSVSGEHEEIELGEGEEVGRMQREYIYVRVLEAVAAARAPEELLGEAYVAAHGADGGGGAGAGHGETRRRKQAGETNTRRGEEDGKGE